MLGRPALENLPRRKPRGSGGAYGDFVQAVDVAYPASSKTTEFQKSARLCDESRSGLITLPRQSRLSAKVAQHRYDMEQHSTKIFSIFVRNSNANYVDSIRDILRQKMSLSISWSQTAFFDVTAPDVINRAAKP